MIVIRLATSADAADFARLNEIFNEEKLSMEQAAKNLAVCAERVFMAFVDERAVGFACVWMIQMVCYKAFNAEITELFVEESFRKQGVGRALMQHVEQVCRAAGADNISICTGPDNMPALHLYHSFGFEDEDIRLRKKL